MSETITTFCDYCNNLQERRPDGRGWCEWPEEVAIKNLEWQRTKDGFIMCPDCQDGEK